jgi:hypothetical protein
MNVESSTPDRTFQALKGPDFEAVLTDVIGGPDFLRPYAIWHSDSPFRLGNVGSQQLDEAFDSLRFAASTDDFKRGVQNLQRVTVDDPPAIYLAWGERARAVSKRFSVPPGDSGRDILATLRLWKPSTDMRSASRN